MPTDKDGFKANLLRLQLILMQSPMQYTVKQLATKLNVSSGTIRNYFKDLRSAGFIIDKDDQNRYGFTSNKTYQQLKDLLLFSEEDQMLLYDAIHQIAPHDKRAERLKKKLSSIYDFKKLGHTYLRKPYLDKIDTLLQAKTEQKRVRLIDYRSSNSNETRTRLVEPFNPKPDGDTLQAFDVEQKEQKHYRISRIKRVEILEDTWQFEKRHIPYPTDPFRIVDAHPVHIHLRFKVGAYNELIERFPLTRQYIEPAAEEGIYDFQCQVNAKFFGISNFILGHYHQHIEVLEPESLVLHLKQRAREIVENLG